MEEFKQRCRKIGVFHFHCGGYPFMREGVNKVALCLFEHNEKAYRAAVWMMERYSEADIVHPTCTGKRYIASEMTLGESVVRGFLPAPKYVTGVYRNQKTLAKYQSRVDIGAGSTSRNRYGKSGLKQETYKQT